jgi:hypothetical protein
MNTAELRRQRLELVYRWYTGMVNRDTGRFEYLYLPQSDRFVRENCPIREIATIWNVEVLGAFLGRGELRPVIETSLRHYCEYLVESDGALILDSEHLREPSSIAHNAFLLLALLHAPLLDHRRVAGLAEGILRQQRPDGSFKTYFSTRTDEGEELYPGEAMLALAKAHARTSDARYLSSATLGLGYYGAEYLRRGRVVDDLLVFFANWQSQAARAMAESTPDVTLRKNLMAYACRVHDRVIEQGFYEHVERHLDRQACVEVACALEGLNDAYALVRISDAKRAERYQRCIRAGLNYLLRVQCTEGGTGRERGGFGMSLADRTQRIDVTGHAASALMKSLANGIECVGRVISTRA